MSYAAPPTHPAPTTAGRLATVLVCALAPALFLQLLLTIVGGAPRAAIINGQFRPAPAGGAWEWLALAVTVLGWCWALSAAVLIIAAAMRGRAVRPAAALLAGLRCLPTVLAAMLLTLAVTALAGLPLLLMAREGFSAVVLLVGLPPLVLVLALIWLPLAVPVAVVEGRGVRAALAAARTAVRGRVGTRLAMVLGMVVLPVLLLSWAAWLRAEVAGSGLWTGALVHALVEVVATVALLLLAAGQAGLLAWLHGRTTQAPAEVIHARLDRLADAARGGPRLQGTLAGRALLWVAGATLPAALAAVVTVANPYGVPVVAADPLPGERRIVAAGWGGHGQPVLVTLDREIEWCLDDSCRRVQREHVPVPIFSDPSTATVGSDGSVLVTFFDQGMQVARCTVADACTLTGIDWPRQGHPFPAGRAVDSRADGSLLVATAQGVYPDGADPEETHPDGVALTLAICPDPACSSPRLVEFGTVDAHLPGAADRDGFRPVDLPTRQQRPEDTLWLGVDAQGAPVLVFHDTRDGRSWVGTCEGAECGEPALAEVAPGTDADPVPPAARGFAPEPVTDLTAPHVLASAPAGDGAITILAEPAPERLEIRVGEPPARWRLSLRHCPDLGCDAGGTSVLRDLGPGQHDVHLAVRHDGTALLVVGDARGYQLLTWSGPTATAGHGVP